MSLRSLPARRLAAAAVAPLALVTLAACGGDDESTADDTSAASSESSEDAAPEDESEAETDAEVAPASADGEEVEASEFMQLFEDAFAPGTAHFVMSSDGGMAGIEAEGDADFSQTPADMTMSMGGSALQGQDMETIMVDGIMYLKMPGMGDGYMKVDLTDGTNPLGVDLGNQLDPRAMFENFEDSITTVVHEGEEEIDGDTVDAYAVSVDAEAVFEGSGQEMPPGVDIPDVITYDMFLNEDGTFRRMAFSLGDVAGGITMDMTDWGKEVSIEAPPADQVTDFPGTGSAAG